MAKQCSECGKSIWMDAADQLGIKDADYHVCTNCVSRERQFRCPSCEHTFVSWKGFRLPKCPECKTRAVAVPGGVADKAKGLSAEEAKYLPLIDKMKTSPKTKGRSYKGTGVDPAWLVAEVVEYAKTKGLGDRQKVVRVEDSTCIIIGANAVLISGTSESFEVKAAPVNEVGLGSAALLGAVTGGLGLLLGGGAMAATKLRIDALLTYIDERVRSRSGTGAASAPEDIPAKLKQLADLRDQGVVSPEEFEKKKAELLARM